MDKIYYKILMISTFVDSATLYIFTNGWKSGNFFIFTVVVHVFTIIPINTIFIWLLNLVKLIKKDDMKNSFIWRICIVCLFSPPMLYFMGTTFFYEDILEEIKQVNGSFTHQSVEWFSPMVLYIYVYLIVLGYYTIKKIVRKIGESPD